MAEFDACPRPNISEPCNFAGARASKIGLKRKEAREGVYRYGIYREWVRHDGVHMRSPSSLFSFAPCRTCGVRMWEG